MKKILVFKHMLSQNPGIFREFAPDLGVVFHEIDLHAGDAFPNLENFDGLWVMGGSMNTSEEDEYPWLIEEKTIIRKAVCDMKMPYLGICLGHQLLADALGGDVGPAKNHELGIYRITPTADGADHPLIADLPAEPGWVNVHLKEVLRAPDAATVLASSQNCANQVMALGKHAYSCQFHPEVCSHTVANWLKIPGIPETLKDLLGESGYAHFQISIAENLPELAAAAKCLFLNWTTLVYSR